MTLPLVSCVLCTHQYGRFLARAIDSVLEQDWPRDRLQVIVVDDGSTDDTPAVAARYGDAITYVRKPNGGLLSTINRGLAEATGDLIAFHSGDDEWAPGRVRRQAGLLAANPDVGLVYGDMEVIDADGAVIHPSFRALERIRIHSGHVLSELVRGNFVSGGAMMVRASLRDRFAPLPPHAGWEDWWVAVRVAEVAKVLAHPEVVHRYRRHGANMNLGASGEQRARLVAAEAPFRRWLLTGLDLEAVKADAVVAAVAHWQHCAAVAEARGVELGHDPAAAEEHARDASARLQAGDAGGALRTAARALGHHPGHARAVAILREAAGRTAAATAPAPPERPAPELDIRSFAVLADAAEVLDVPELLAAYGRVVDGGDDATLVIALPEAHAGAEVLERLQAVVAQAGLERDGAADVYATVVRDPAALGPRVRAVLSRRPVAPGPLAALPRVDDRTAAELRRLLATASSAR